MSNFNFINLTGKRFERLTVIKRVGSNKWGNTTWLCKCDCGIEKIIASRQLINGHVKSCGCLQRESRRKKRSELGVTSMRTLIISYKACAKKRGYIYKLTEEQFKEITQKNCYYCGARPDNIMKPKRANGVYIYNGIDRIDNKKGYSIDNVVPCCWGCNNAKSERTQEEYKRWVKKSYENLYK